MRSNILKLALTAVVFFTVVACDDLTPLGILQQLGNLVWNDSFTDPRDGKKYKTVKIGTQTWMAENLDYGGEKNDIGVCHSREPENCKMYGALYSFEQAISVCPQGWHLPSKEEWDALVDFAGGKEIAGKKLKAKSGWKDKECEKRTTGRGEVIDDCGGTDEFGFSALPGGMAGVYGALFNEVGYGGAWWGATMGKYGTVSVYVCDFGLHANADCRMSGGNVFHSVRCIKDAETEQKSVKKEKKEKEETQAETSDQSFDCARASSPAEKAYCTGQTVEEFLGQAEISPSFDCAKASTPSEKAICSNTNLAKLDNRLAEAYKKARSACKTDVKKEQKEWLKKMSSCTSNVKCLEDSYSSRIQELENCR